MIGGGFVVIRRALLEHPAFRNEGEAMQFAWMIARAAWKPTRVRYKERAIHLQRGQLAVSVRDMARALDRPRMTIHDFLQRLKNQDSIQTDNRTGVLIVTICNYSKYQDYDAEARTDARTATRTGAGQGPDTEQQSKQVKQDSAPKAQSPKRSFLPDDWQPPAVSELPPKAQECARQWPAELYAREAEAFGLYWQSERKTKADWPKTWANRIINQHWKVMQEARRDPGRAGNGGDKPLWETLREARGNA